MSSIKFPHRTLFLILCFFAFFAAGIITSLIARSQQIPATDIFAKGGCVAGLQYGSPLDNNKNILLDEAALDLLKSAGARCIRINFRLGSYASWTPDALSRYTTIVDNARKRGLTVVGTLSNESWHGKTQDWQYNNAEKAKGTGFNHYLDQFSKFAAVPLTKHFSGKITTWEIWNEPDQSPTYLYPSNFAQLLAHVYTDTRNSGVKNIQFISGGVVCDKDTSRADYITGLYTQGKKLAYWDDVKKQYGSYPLDLIGQHIYIQRKTLANPADIKWCLDSLRKAYTQAEGSDKKQTVVTEFGWATSDVSEATQANNLKSAYNTFSQTSFVQGAYWFFLKDEPAANLTFGLVKTDGKIKPSFTMYQKCVTGTCPSSVDTQTFCPVCMAQDLLAQQATTCSQHKGEPNYSSNDCDFLAEHANSLHTACLDCQQNRATCSVCSAAPVLQEAVDWCYNHIGKSGITSSSCNTLSLYTQSVHEECNSRGGPACKEPGNNPPQPTGTNYKIAGHVRDAQGNGIPGVKVLINNYDRQSKPFEVLTNTGGDFELKGVVAPGGWYYVKIAGNETSPQSAPGGFASPAKTVTPQNAQDHCLDPGGKKVTPVGSTAYLCQEAGRDDCSTKGWSAWSSTQQYNSRCDFVYSPVVKPTQTPVQPTPPPGCYYQKVQCGTAVCAPILVCPTMTPIPTPVYLNSISTFEHASGDQATGGKPKQTAVSSDGRYIHTRLYQNGTWDIWSKLAVKDIGIAGVDSIKSISQGLNPQGAPKQDILSKDGRTIYSRVYSGGWKNDWITTNVSSLGLPGGISQISSFKQVTGDAETKNRVKQMLVSADGSLIYYRFYENGQWQAWGALGVNDSITGLGAPISAISSFSQGLTPDGKPKQDILIRDGKTIYSRIWNNGWGSWYSTNPKSPLSVYELKIAE